MISSQTRHYVPWFDELIQEGDGDFVQSGLKVASVIRVGRLAVVSGEILLGAIGEISPERLRRVKQTLANWLCPGETADNKRMPQIYQQLVHPVERPARRLERIPVDTLRTAAET